MGQHYIFKTLEPEATHDEDFRRQWSELLSASGHLDRMYQSPEYFDHLVATQGSSSIKVVSIKDKNGLIVGVVPFLEKELSLHFNIRKRTYYKPTLNAAVILGSVPLLKDKSLHAELFREIFNACPNSRSIYIDCLPTDSALGFQLLDKTTPLDGFSVHIPNGMRPFHILSLPNMFSDFLSRFKAKHRGNLKRQVKKLNDEAGGSLQLRLLEKPAQVRWFLSNASNVARESWQYRVLGERVSVGEKEEKKFIDLITRGLSRSYLLTGKDKHYAFVIGHLYDNVFHYNEIAYDQAYSKFSPGRVALYLIIQDIVENTSAKWLNFGVGDADYKSEFGNILLTDCSAYIVKDYTRESFLLKLNHIFRSAVLMAKKMRQLQQ